MKTEKPKIKEKRLKHEIELEQRPEPLDGEAFDVWLKRIGGPNVKLLESLKEYKMPKSKEKTPLMINRNGNFVLNSENVGIYFNKEKLDERLNKKDPNISYIKKNGEYRLKKELFTKPEGYFHVIGEELKQKQKIVADKKFGKSLEKWAKETGYGKKEPTPEEKIAKKEKELEDAQQKYNIYYSPVVKDMLGLYYEKQVKDLTKELKELRKGYKKEEKAEEKKEEPAKTSTAGSVVGGGLRMGESAEDIETRLQELSAEIPASSVLGRSKLEKEQKRLQKRLKKFKKLKKK